MKILTRAEYAHNAPHAAATHRDAQRRRSPSRARARSGAVLVLAAILMVAMMAMIAFAVDVGRMCLARNQLQDAADSAALAGALAAYSDGGIDPARVRTVAVRYAAYNAAAGEQVAISNADVVLGKWDATKAKFTALPSNQETQADAVHVSCERTSARGNPLSLFFARVIGVRTADVTARATARISPSRCGLIIGLTSVSMSGSSFTDSYNSGNGPYSLYVAGQNGHVCSNGNITMSGSTEIEGNAHPGPGKKVISSSSKGVSGKTEPLAKAMNYPAIDPGNAATINDNASIPLSDNNKHPLNNKNEFTLSGGDGVDLPPGTYYFSKISLSGGSSIRVSGMTKIYVTGDVALSGGTVINATLAPKNVQLFAMGNTCTISGTAEFYGVVYGPEAKITRSGDSDYFGAIVGAQLDLSGSGGIHADDALNLGFLNQGPNLSTLLE